MIDQLPFWIELGFLVCVLYTILFFYLSNSKPIKITLIILLIAVVQSVLAYQGFYLESDSVPPRFIVALLPSIILITFGLSSKQMAWIAENRDMRLSTFLHTVRIFVEIILYYLFVYKMIPELMTFEGRNFDILAGLTALVIFALVIKNNIGDKALLIWNIIGLCLVSFIAANGVLSAELPFQQFAFDQPNRALNYFPFILLPAVVVPLVIYTHITDIIILKRRLKN